MKDSLGREWFEFKTVLGRPCFIRLDTIRTIVGGSKGNNPGVLTDGSNTLIEISPDDYSRLVELLISGTVPA